MNNVYIITLIPFAYIKSFLSFRSSGPVSYGFASLENSAMLDTETICSVGSNSDDSGPPSLQNEFETLQTVEKSAETDTLQQQNQATSPQSDSSPIVPNAPSNGLLYYFFTYFQTQLYKFLHTFWYLFFKENRICKFLRTYRVLLLNLINTFSNYYVFKEIFW